MDPPFSLLSAKWIPINRADGSRDRIAPHEITSDHDSNPIVSFAWPRPDFDLAAHEFLIGLLAVAFPPKHQNDWLRYFHTPPPPEELREAFQPYTAAFSLDGEGTRFLQDFSPLEGESWPVEALFIEAPGTSKATIDKNNDLLVKRGRFSVLSRASAAMALYTLQQFAPEGGSGHRTSLRGGGPLVTFIVPGAPENGRVLALSQKLWLHVPQSTRPLDKGRMALAFPWLAPTITSESKVTISEVDADRLQAFFGMPRRIRLLFEKNDTLRPCDVTGVVDEIVVRRFTMRPRGVEYGVWRHPLTPYYKDNTVTRPVHTPEGSVGYRQWLGLVYESANGSRLPARAVVEARPRLRDAGSSYMGDARLFAGGYKAKSANILAFAEAEMPIHVVENEDLEKRISNFSETLVEAASTATSALCLKIRTALLGSKRKGDMGSTLLDAPRERLWTDTERDFHNLLTDAIEQLENDKTGDAQIALAERWRGTLEQRALRIFDETAPLDDFGATDPRQLVEARRSLVLAFKGFGKMGRGLFNELGLPAAQPKADRSNEAKAKRKEDTRA
jgi:CRISPR system Cascade subunit CasA